MKNIWKDASHVIPLSSSGKNILRKEEKVRVSFSALLCCGDHFATYFENCIEVDKVLEGCPIKMDHFGVLPALLSFGTFSLKLLSTLFELWITGLAWKQKKLINPQTSFFAQLDLRPSGHWVRCLWSHCRVFLGSWPWFLIESSWLKEFYLLCIAQSYTTLCLQVVEKNTHCVVNEWLGRR